MASVTVSELVARGRDILARGAATLWRSGAALVASPAVWAATGLVFVLGFSIGHWERGLAVRKLKNERTEMAKELSASQARVAQANQAAREARVALEAEIKARKTAEDVKSHTVPVVTSPRPTKRIIQQ